MEVGVYWALISVKTVHESVRFFLKLRRCSGLEDACENRRGYTCR